MTDEDDEDGGSSALIVTKAQRATVIGRYPKAASIGIHSQVHATGSPLGGCDVKIPRFLRTLFLPELP